jgi:hypothetical protein
MAIAKGIQRSAKLKLGKRAAKRDRRNLKFAAILRAPLKLPKQYDFDKKHPGAPTPMFANDEIGNCVIAGRAHQTFRFELIEQKKVIRIRTADVTREYFKQTGGKDTGLVALESLKRWRKVGWKIGKNSLKIQAFSELNRSNHNEIKQAIVLDIGVGVGLALPAAADAQFNSGKLWEVVTGSQGKINSWGGHYVYVCGYTDSGPVCVTWGEKQEMTWDFFDKYCDEAYGIIDALNTAKVKKALDTKRLAAFLSKH